MKDANDKDDTKAKHHSTEAKSHSINVNAIPKEKVVVHDMTTEKSSDQILESDTPTKKKKETASGNDKAQVRAEKDPKVDTKETEKENREDGDYRLDTADLASEQSDHSRNRKKLKKEAHHKSEYEPKSSGKGYRKKHQEVSFYWQISLQYQIKNYGYCR